MTTNATAAPSRTAARRYSEQLHVLVDERTRAYVLGLAALDAADCGYETLKQGEQIRDLLDEAILRRYKSDPKAYAEAVAAGEREMEKLKAKAAQRARQTTGRVAAVAGARA
jgi:hypothetical protein